jgi:hypothetical protein
MSRHDGRFSAYVSALWELWGVLSVLVERRGR